MAISLKFKYIALCAAAFPLCACGAMSNDDVSKVITTEVAIQDLPASVVSLIMEAQPDLVISEVLKKERGARVYYDVEGEHSDGSELEFDVLLRASGPEIVEIQRDIDWSSVPEPTRKLVNDANKNSNGISRVIESTQTDGAIIYEVFIEGYPADPRFEVWSKESNFKLLSTRWEH